MWEKIKDMLKMNFIFISIAIVIYIWLSVLFYWIDNINILRGVLSFYIIFTWVTNILYFIKD